MRLRVDRVPRVARDPPADRRFLLERIKVFGLTAQQVEYRPILEQAAQLALAYEAGEVGREQRREDRVGLRVKHRLHNRPRVDLAQRDGELDELDAAALLG